MVSHLKYDYNILSGVWQLIILLFFIIIVRQKKTVCKGTGSTKRNE